MKLDFGEILAGLIPAESEFSKGHLLIVPETVRQARRPDPGGGNYRQYHPGPEHEGIPRNGRNRLRLSRPVQRTGPPPAGEQQERRPGEIQRRAKPEPSNHGVSNRQGLPPFQLFRYSPVPGILLEKKIPPGPEDHAREPQDQHQSTFAEAAGGPAAAGDHFVPEGGGDFSGGHVRKPKAGVGRKSQYPTSGIIMSPGTMTQQSVGLSRFCH